MPLLEDRMPSGFPPPPMRQPALPLCSNTTTISTRQLNTKNVDNTHGANRKPRTIIANPTSSAIAHFVHDCMLQHLKFFATAGFAGTICNSRSLRMTSLPSSLRRPARRPALPAPSPLVYWRALRCHPTESVHAQHYRRKTGHGRTGAKIDEPQRLFRESPCAPFRSPRLAPKLIEYGGTPQGATRRARR